MGRLILIRHGLSSYNAQGLWTGWDDPDITPEGRQEMQKAAESLADIPLDLAFTSELKRMKHSLLVLLETLRRTDVPVHMHQSLRERNYGVYTAKNKWQIQKELGKEEFIKLRRGWDYPIPQGESLKQVYERVVPYYDEHILPELKKNKNIVVVGSGNVLRALAKNIEQISDTDIVRLEIGTGEVLVYTIDEQGNVVSKERRNNNPNHV